MSTDTGRVALGEAWMHIPPSREDVAELGRFTRARIERIVTLAAGVGLLAVGVQGFFSALGQVDERPEWQIPLMILAFTPLTLLLIAIAVNRFIALFAGVFAWAYMLVLVLWPVATIGVLPVYAQHAWIWYLVNGATVAAVLAFRLPLQIFFVLVCPVLYCAVRLTQGDFIFDFYAAVMVNASFALLFGCVLFAIVWVFRSLAANVDRAREEAVATYANAAAAAAAEEERVAMNALMHDSVLAALIAAERAHSPRERMLATDMAREALTRLANAEGTGLEGSDAPVSRAAIADRIDHAAAELGIDLEVERIGVDDGLIVRGRVARAIVLAATQAVTNAVTHAGGVGLAASVTAVGDEGVVVTVRDKGPGIDMASVPADRLGIRASIIARVAAVGGTAEVESDAGGTTVTIAWTGEPAC